ncbi:hypothetical protein BGW38_002521, partial [Lunasporangiospora selenospora]
MPFFKSHKNQTTSAAVTPAQTPRTSISEHDQRPNNSSIATNASKTMDKDSVHTMYQLMSTVMH